MSIGECKLCAFWQGGDGASWCEHGHCYTEPDHYTHCYCSREERFEKRQLSLTFEK